MATGITIDEVTNTLDDIQGTEKIPVSSGISEPEVVTTGDLKDYINDGMQEEISDLSTIRSGASAGATAYQKPSSGIPSTDLASAVQTSLGKADTALQSFTETDPTVPSWAKASSKPSYSASEVGAVPTTRTVNGKSLSSNIALTASDVEALPSSTVIPDVSGFITNTVDDLVYYYTKSQTYSQTEVQQLINAVKQFTYELVSVLPAASASTMNKIYLVPSSDPQIQNIKDEYITLESSGSYSWEQIGSTAIDLSDYVTTTALNTALADYTTSTDLSTLLAGYQTKIDSTHKLDYSLIDNTPTIPDITNCVQKNETAGLLKNDGTVDTNAYLTSETEPDFNGSAAASITSSDITAWNGKSTFSGSYNDLTDKPTLFSGAYADLTGKPNLATVATSGDYDDLSNKPTIPSAVTESTVSGWGFTKNAGTITGVTMNGASKGTSGVVDLGTVITAHQDISGKADKATTLSGYGITDAKIVSGVITLGSDTITPLTSHQDISGKADKSEMSVSTSSDQTTITLKSGTSATVINQHQSLSGYVQTSNTTGLIKNDGTIDTTSYGTYSKPSGGIPASDIASGVIPVVPSNIVVGSNQSYTIAVVSSLPASPDADTIYLVTGS